MDRLTINKNGQAYISKGLADRLKNVKKMKIVPFDRSSFEIVFNHKKPNTIYKNERGTYIYASKKLLPGHYVVDYGFYGTKKRPLLRTC